MAVAAKTKTQNIEIERVRYVSHTTHTHKLTFNFSCPFGWSQNRLNAVAAAKKRTLNGFSCILHHTSYKMELNMKINMKHAIKIIEAYAWVFHHNGCLLLHSGFRKEPKDGILLCVCVYA